MFSLSSLCPLSAGLNFNPILTKIAVQVLTKLLIFSSFSGLVQNYFTALESCRFPSLLLHHLLLKVLTRDCRSDGTGQHHFFAPVATECFN